MPLNSLEEKRYGILIKGFIYLYFIYYIWDYIIENTRVAQFVL